MEISGSSPSEILFQLEENFRMNPQLCNFVELIYQKRFHPMQTRQEVSDLGCCIADHLASPIQSNIRHFLEGMASVMQFGTSKSMRPPISGINLKISMATTLFLMNLVPKLDHFSPSELHLQLESKIIAQLVRELSNAFKKETIFIVTPHRMQRSFVTKELLSFGISLRGHSSRDLVSTPRIWVDTTERMQGISPDSNLIPGSEADIVVCVFSHTHMPSLRRDLEFIYNRPRLNVAISRAKSISIVISSEGVLNPPVEALVEKDNLEGFAYLKAYEDRAWSCDHNLESIPQNQKYYPPVRG
jgi:AAA domain